MSAPTVVILIFCFASVALADDFKTINGKEYKHVKVKRVEPDGIVLTTKSGISKIYFTELPKEVQERFGYDAVKVEAERAAENAAEEKRIEEQRAANEEARHRNAAAEREHLEKAQKAAAAANAAEEKRIEEQRAAEGEHAEKARKAEADLIQQFETAEESVAQSYASSAKATLSGQVFVSTKGGENFKLGAVQVSLFARDAIDTLVTNLKAYANAKIEQLREPLAAAKTAMEQTKAAKEQAEAQERTAQDAYLKSIGGNGSKEAERLSNWAREDANKAREAADTASTEYSKILREENAYYSAAFCFMHLRSPIRTAETDADGKFVIEVPRTGAFVITAEGERSVGQQTERYYWLQPVSLEGRQQGVQNLSNTNLRKTLSSLIFKAD